MPSLHHLPITTATTHLSAAARRILHSLTTIPSLSASHLLPLLPSIRALLPSLPSSFLSSLLSSSPSSLLPLLLPSLLPLLPSPLPFHSPIIKLNLLPSSPFMSSSLLHSYALLHLPSALQLFEEIPHLSNEHPPSTSTSTYTTLIQSLNHHHLPHLALSMFNQMLYSGVPPNRVTMVCALSACTARAALETGTWIHRYITYNRWKLDVVLGTALVNMYAKCGRMGEGLKVFLAMEERNVYTWNTLIGGFAGANSGEEVVRWFRRMDVEPDEVTLIEVLSGCSRSGLVEVGSKVFDEMSRGKYGFQPGIKHYGCMVDMLGRAGMVDEAFEMVGRMEDVGQPGVVVWGSLLAGCRAHGRLELAEVAARKMVELEPENVGHYVALANLFGGMGKWREAEEVWRVVKEKGMRKDAGWSCVQAGLNAENDEYIAERTTSCLL